MLPPTSSLPVSTMPMSDMGRLRSWLRSGLRGRRREALRRRRAHARRREPVAEDVGEAGEDRAHRLERLGHRLERRRRRGSRASGPTPEESLPALPSGGWRRARPARRARSTTSVELPAAVRLDRRLEVVPAGDRGAVDGDDLVAALQRRPSWAALPTRRPGRRWCWGRRSRGPWPAITDEDQQEGDDEVHGDAGEDHRQALAGWCPAGRCGARRRGRPPRGCSSR